MSLATGITKPSTYSTGTSLGMNACVPRTTDQAEVRHRLCKKVRPIGSSGAYDIVGKALELEEERIPERHLALSHQDAGRIGLRTNPPMRTGHAAHWSSPAEFGGSNGIGAK